MSWVGAAAVEQLGGKGERHCFPHGQDKISHLKPWEGTMHPPSWNKWLFQGSLCYSTLIMHRTEEISPMMFGILVKLIPMMTPWQTAQYWRPIQNKQASWIRKPDCTKQSDAREPHARHQPSNTKLGYLYFLIAPDPFTFSQPAWGTAQTKGSLETWSKNSLGNQQCSTANCYRSRTGWKSILHPQHLHSHSITISKPLTAFNTFILTALQSKGSAIIPILQMGRLRLNDLPMLTQEEQGIEARSPTSPNQCATLLLCIQTAQLILSRSSHMTSP